MEERRRAKRYCIWFPMTLNEQGEPVGLAVSQNISKQGVLMATASSLQESEPVSVTFRIAPADQQRTVTGRIVRLRANDRDPDGMWPQLVAVEFDEPVPEIESLLEDLEESSPESRA